MRKLKSFTLINILIFMSVIILNFLIFGCGERNNWGKFLFRFAQINDVHINGGATYWWHMGTIANPMFRQALKDIEEKKVDFLVLAGDITNIGTQQNYDTLAAITRSLQIPFGCAAGNHESARDTNYTRFKKFYIQNKKIDYIAQDSVQYVMLHKDFAFIFISNWLNPFVPPYEAFPDTSFLHKMLDKYKNKYCVVIQHAYPMYIKRYGSRESKYSRCLGADELISLIRKHTSALGILSGHNHINQVGSIDPDHPEEADSFGGKLFLTHSALCGYPCEIRYFDVYENVIHCFTEPVNDSELISVTIKDAERRGEVEDAEFIRGRVIDREFLYWYRNGNFKIEQAN